MRGIVNIESTASRLHSRHTVGLNYAGNGKHLPEADAAVIVRADLGQGSITVHVSREGGRKPSPGLKEKEIKKAFRALANKLCEDHPSISTDEEVLGGTPHIKNTRLSVGKVLAKLYVHGDIKSVVKIHEPHLSEEQVKEAIAFAQDFLEIACDEQEAT